jgi:hypothetical protein
VHPLPGRIQVIDETEVGKGLEATPKLRRQQVVALHKVADPPHVGVLAVPFQLGSCIVRAEVGLGDDAVGKAAFVGDFL